MLFVLTYYVANDGVVCLAFITLFRFTTMICEIDNSFVEYSHIQTDCEDHSRLAYQYINNECLMVKTLQ